MAQAQEPTYPSVQYGMPYDDYAQAPGVRATWLQAFERCGAYAKHVRDHEPEPTEALILGIAAHVLTLEPHVFDERFVKSPKFNLRKNVGKADAAAFAADNADRMILDPNQYDAVHRWREAVWSHEDARALLSGHGANEVSVWVKDPETGLLRKSRDDRHVSVYGDKTLLVDLKTCSVPAQHGKLDGHIANFHYHTRAAYHLDNATLAMPGQWKVKFIFIEKKPPHLVAVYPLADDALEQGRRNYRRWLHDCHRCEQTGKWPGYPGDGEEMSIPSWAFDPDDSEPSTLNIGGEKLSL